MPKRTRPPVDASEQDDYPITLEQTTELIAYHWQIFRKFQISKTQTPRNALDAELHRRIIALVEQDEDSAKALFGAGIISGMSVMLKALQDGQALMYHLEQLEEQMRHRPDAKRPRA